MQCSLKRRLSTSPLLSEKHATQKYQVPVIFSFHQKSKSCPLKKILWDKCKNNFVSLQQKNVKMTQLKMRKDSNHTFSYPLGIQNKVKWSKFLQILPFYINESKKKKIKSKNHFQLSHYYNWSRPLNRLDCCGVVKRHFTADVYYRLEVAYKHIILLCTFLLFSPCWFFLGNRYYNNK